MVWRHIRALRIDNKPQRYNFPEMKNLASLNSIMSRLHAKQLRLLIALAEKGSLLNAAEGQGLTQPGASKALKELESALGVELFLRTNRGAAAAPPRVPVRFASPA